MSDGPGWGVTVSKLGDSLMIMSPATLNVRIIQIPRANSNSCLPASEADTNKGHTKIVKSYRIYVSKKSSDLLFARKKYFPADGVVRGSVTKSSLRMGQLSHPIPFIG